MLSETSQLKEDRYYKIPLTGGTWSSPGFPGGSDSKQSACNAGDPGSIPRSGGSPREGNGNPLQSLAWRIPWMEEPGELRSMGRKESDTTELLTYNRAPQLGQKPSGGCPWLG